MALHEAIKDAEGKAESKEYTKASKESLKAVLAEARKVAENVNATQEQVTDATAKLQEAATALQVKVTGRQNIGLKKTVTVSGTSNGVKEAINDGDETTKWDSDLIKNGTGNTAQDIGDAWFVVDLGEQTNLIDGLKVSYFNKVYPTDYEVQVSNDNKNWTTVKTLKKEHNGATHPKDDIQFETPVSARYVRMFFKELNNVAAGHGVGINEAEVLGRYVYENAAVQSVSANTDILVQKDSVFDMSQLPAVNGIQIAVEEMAETMQALVPVTWNTDKLDMSKPDTYKLEGTLSLSGITNPDHKKANVNVVVQGELTEELNYTALDEQLIIAEEKEQDKDKYTAESYDVFEKAYESAKEARENATEQKVIDAAADSLKQAIAGLQEKPAEPEIPDVDKSKLQAKVDEYSKLNAEEYTKESWNGFAEVLEEAKAVLKDEKATQDAIDAIFAQLNTAHASLEKAESPQPQPTPPTDPSEPAKPTPPTNPSEPTKPTTPEKPDKEKPSQQKPAKTGDPASAFGIFTSMMLAGGYILGRRKTKPTTPEKPDKEKPSQQKPAKTGDPASAFGIFTSMMLAGGYILGRRKKDDK